MYKLCPSNYDGTPTNCVIRTTDGACIPFDPDNTDYQAYLKWLDEGNEPLAADENISEPAEGAE
jgi:hypothetical protein